MSHRLGGGDTVPFEITHHGRQDEHEWVMACAKCDLDDPSDRLVTTTVDLVRRSYGESAVAADAVEIFADEIAAGTFQMDHLTAAMRMGLPDPAKEGNKPPQLTNYRSQTAEMIAKGALAKAYHFEYPAAPQEGSANPNQPILGFDGWGFVGDGNGGIALGLIQVKATEAAKSPPPDATALADECKRVPTDVSALCRALTLLARLLHGDPLQSHVLQMLEQLGQGRLPAMRIAPAVVRGLSAGSLTDLDPVRQAVADLSPASLRAVVVTIGVCLQKFGLLVMNRAREAA